MNETNSENAAETEMALNWLNGHRVATGVVTAGGLIPGASPFTTLGGAGLALLGTQLPQADTVDTYTEVSEQRRKDALEEGVDMRLWMLEGAATASGTMSEEEIAELHGYYSNDPDGDHEQLIYQSLEEAEEAAGYNGSPYWNLRESRGG